MKCKKRKICIDFSTKISSASMLKKYTKVTQSFYLEIKLENMLMKVI